MTDPQGAATGDQSDWPRALGLFTVAMGLSIVRPSVLVGVPLIALLLVRPSAKLPAIAAGLLAALLVFGVGPDDGLWYAERAWAILLAGWFAALSLRWPGTNVFPRAAGAVLGASVIVAVVMSLQPERWVVIDWAVQERIRAGVGTAMEAMRAIGDGERAVSPALLATVQAAMEFQAQVFPAMLALSSLAALGVAWWLHRRLTGGGGAAVRPVGEFRFNDHLVWVFIAGLLLLLVGWGDSWGRAGTNTLVVMSALYALRGAAVVMYVTGGLSFFGATMLLFAFLFIAPVIFGLALLIGLGDTWMDLRERLRRQAA